MSTMKAILISGKDSNPPLTEFSGVVGQTNVIGALQFLLASHDLETPFPTLLFSGSHGLGKTFLAEKVANNLGRRFVVVNSEMVETERDFFEEVVLSNVAGSQPVTLLLDECHRLTRDIETALLTALAPNKSGKNIINYKQIDIEWDMSKINVIFATTDTHEMAKPLVSRAKIIQFEKYNDDDLFEIVKMYAPKLNITCSKEEIAMAARGRARGGFDLSQDLLRIAKINKVNTIGYSEWEKLKGILGIYPLGLKRVEVELLKSVAKFEPISAINLATRMMLNEENIKEEIEIRLRELGLINNTNRGRVLTDEGKIYLSKHQNV